MPVAQLLLLSGLLAPLTRSPLAALPWELATSLTAIVQPRALLKMIRYWRAFINYSFRLVFVCCKRLLKGKGHGKADNAVGRAKQLRLAYRQTGKNIVLNVL